MAIGLHRTHESSDSDPHGLDGLPTRHVDRVLAWYGVANAIGSAFRRGAHKRKWARERPSGGSRELVAVVAGVTALAVGAYAIRRHYQRQQAMSLAEQGQLHAGVSMAIQASPRSLYDLLTNPQRLSEIVETAELLDVSQQGVARWRLAHGPHEAREYDVHTVDDGPGSLIGWRIVGTDADACRAVISLEATDGGHGTRVRVLVEPDDRTDATREPAQAQRWKTRLAAMTPVIAAQLRRLKQSVETGELATTQGQPVGKRSLIGKLLVRGES